MKSFPTLTDHQLEDKLFLSKSIFHDFQKDLKIDDRIQNILKAKYDLQKNKLKYAELITIEMGKPISQAISEIEKCIFLCQYYADNATGFLKDKEIKTSASKSYVTYQPVGAVFGIMPWNFPFWQVFRYSIPALLAGNIVLLKHAPNVPQCAIALEKLFTQAFGQKGIFQSLFIEVEQVEKVIASEIVQGVTLTGSDQAGSSVAALAGKYIKKCVLELGGTDAFIVLKDADLEEAAKVAIQSRMNNCGQTCISAKRIIVHESIADHFTNLLVKEINKLKIGDPLDLNTELSCMARPDLVNNLETQVHSSVESGAQVIIDGGSKGKNSNYFDPVLLTNINRDMAVYKEEVFGPVAVVINFETEEEAIEIANDSIYGLGAAVWSKDLKRAEKNWFSSGSWRCSYK